MDRPLRPDNRLPPIADRPMTRPSPGTRPDLSERPGIAARPGIGDRPSLGDRPGAGNIATRPIDLANRPIDRHPQINARPGWVNINNNTINLVQNNWQSAIVRPSQVGAGLHHWLHHHPDRLHHWGHWAQHVRHHWHYHHHHHLFRPSWWHVHHHAFGGWHYGHSFHLHGWTYWWTRPSWQVCTNWFAWRAPTVVWSQPIYYDYGVGGNVVYRNNVVYIDDRQVATAEEFAQTAAALATVPPPASEEEAAKVEWLPLGTFALSSNEKETEPSHVIQLAVSKEGIVSGTLVNTQTEKAQTVQGQVDKETQRVAFRIANSDTFVAETGLYNLTQDEAPLLVHFGDEQTETWLLVRLEQPQEATNE